jgi:hypothetical protein
MEIISLLSLLIAGGGIYLFSKVFRDFQPGNKKIQADLKKMQEEIDSLSVDLVPLNLEELELVSFGQELQVVKKRFTPTGRGVFTTIYHEPAIAYSYKKYTGSKVQALIFAKTTQYQFAYLVRKNGVQVVVNKDLLGTFQENEGVLYEVSGRRKKALAQIRIGPEGVDPVVVGGREVASLNPVNPNNAVLSQRAFAFVKSDISGEEIKLFLSIAVFRMVRAVMPVK